jgi:septum formation protein
VAETTQKLELILCSASPRRAALLKELAVRFRVCPVEVSEAPLSGESPWNTARRLALLKLGKARADQTGALVLTADTVVDLDGTALGKPASEEEAVWMLRTLSGRRHLVHTAVALGGPDFLRTVTCTTEVEMRAYAAREIAASVASGQPMDKAGAYAIQDDHLRPVRRIHGLYSNVVGLPLSPTARLLGRSGVPVTGGVHERALPNSA